MAWTRTTDGPMCRATSRNARLSSRALSRTVGSGPAVLVWWKRSPAPVARAATAARAVKDRGEWKVFMCFFLSLRFSFLVAFFAELFGSSYGNRRPGVGARGVVTRREPERGDRGSAA